MGALLGWAGDAAADLYRWVDPESGSIKFSSYPPPWYGDSVKSRRAPKVELIPGERSAPSTQKAATATAKPTPAAARGEGEDGGGPLDTLRKELLRKLGVPSGADFQRGADGLKQQLEAYDAVAKELDRIDPKGAARRRAESQSVLDKIREGLRAQFSTQPPVK
jgi:hypothetical protein